MKDRQIKPLRVIACPQCGQKGIRCYHHTDDWAYVQCVEMPPDHAAWLSGSLIRWHRNQIKQLINSVRFHEQLLAGTHKPKRAYKKTERHKPHLKSNSRAGRIRAALDVLGWDAQAADIAAMVGNCSHRYSIWSEAVQRYDDGPHVHPPLHKEIEFVRRKFVKYAQQTSVP